MRTRIKKPKKQVNLENITPKDDILLKLGTTIKASRKKKGFTSFEHFAYQMDISRSLYAKYEAGSDLRVSTLFRIIEGMGMKVSDFFKGFPAIADDYLAKAGLTELSAKLKALSTK